MKKRNAIEVQFDYHVRASSIDLTVHASVDREAQEAALDKVHVTADPRLVLDLRELAEVHPRLRDALVEEAFETAELWNDATRDRRPAPAAAPLDDTERAVLAKLGKENDEMCDQLFELRKERDELQEKLAEMALENTRLLAQTKGRAA